MKYLLAQPANEKFRWELDVFLTSLRSFDKETPVVLLFLHEDPSVPRHFEGRYPNLEIHTYHDGRQKRNYIPTIRPYLIWNYLKEDTDRQNGAYFQADSDIVFREPVDLSIFTFDGKTCYGADCEGYIGSEYLLSRGKGKYIVDNFSGILNISVDNLMNIPGIGAQWVYDRPSAQLWWHIWQDSQLLYDFLQGVQSDIQKWTAEMWAQLYNFSKFGWDIRVSPELAFCRPTDTLEAYAKVKILHNAGVTAPMASTLFFKGAYLDTSPFGADLSYVDPDKAGWHYARAIEAAYTHIV